MLCHIQQWATKNIVGSCVGHVHYSGVDMLCCSNKYSLIISASNNKCYPFAPVPHGSARVPASPGHSGTQAISDADGHCAGKKVL